MTKVLFCVALTACLLVSAHSLSLDFLNILAPVEILTNTVGNTLGGLTTAVGGITGGLTTTVGGLTNALGNTLGGLTAAVGGITEGLTTTVGGLTNGLILLVEGLLKTVLMLVTAVLDILLKLIVEVANLVGNLLQGALLVPGRVGSTLADTVRDSLNPANILAAATAVLQPTLDALTSLTNQLSGTAAAGCLINSGPIRGSVFRSVGEILTCGRPVANKVNDLNKEINSITTKGVNFTNQVFGKSTNCVQQSSTSGNVGGLVKCVVDPVIETASLATNTLSDAAALVSKTLSSTLEVPTCATTVLTNTLKKNIELLQSIVQCAAEKNVTVTLPNILNLVPNFTGVANKAISAIEDILRSASGPVKNLLQTLEQIKSIAATLTPKALNAIDTSIQSVQQIINLGTKVAGGNMEALCCVSDAQKVLTDLAPEAVNAVVSCTVNITKDTAPLTVQAVTFDIGLKTDLLGAGPNALAKCSVFSLSLDNAAENCFAAVISEVQSYVKGQLSKINNAVNTAQSLIDTTKKCLNNVLSRNTAVGKTIVDRQKECLAQQGITLTTNEITPVRL